MIEVTSREAEVKSLHVGSYLRDDDEHFVTLALKICPQPGEIPVADAASRALQLDETAQIQIPAQTSDWEVILTYDLDIVTCTATCASSTCGIGTDGPEWLSVKLKARIKGEHLPRLAKMVERTIKISAWPIPEEEPEEKPPTPKAAPLMDYLAAKGATLEISVLPSPTLPAPTPEPVTVELTAESPVEDAAAFLGAVTHNLSCDPTPDELPALSSLTKRHGTMLARLESNGGALDNADLTSDGRRTMRELHEHNLVKRHADPIPGGERVRWLLA